MSTASATSSQLQEEAMAMAYPDASSEWNEPSTADIILRYNLYPRYMIEPDYI
ncbi:MAG: hypothetical protein OIN89_07085 [Candidatus Methanoperedens sp.]|nr:hypothetical protein [Candidatus Methanoperedens sp.]